MLTRGVFKETLGLLVHPDTDYQHAEAFYQQLLDTDATLRAEIERLRGERTDDQLHTDNIELRIEITRLTEQVKALEGGMLHDTLVAQDQKIAALTAQLATMTQERDTAMSVSNAFLEGGVTEELLRRHDGHIKLAKGCCIVIEEEWSNLLRQLAEREARVKELEGTIRHVNS